MIHYIITVLGDYAAEHNLLACRYVREGLLSLSLDMNALRVHIQCVEDTQALRDALPQHGLVAFVGNGAILPRCQFELAKHVIESESLWRRAC